VEKGLRKSPCAGSNPPAPQGTAGVVNVTKDRGGKILLLGKGGGGEAEREEGDSAGRGLREESVSR